MLKIKPSTDQLKEALDGLLKQQGRQPRDVIVVVVSKELPVKINRSYLPELNNNSDLMFHFRINPEIRQYELFDITEYK